MLVIFRVPVLKLQWLGKLPCDVAILTFDLQKDAALQGSKGVWARNRESIVLWSGNIVRAKLSCKNGRFGSQ